MSCNYSDESVGVVTLTLECSVAVLLLTAMLVCSCSQNPLPEKAAGGADIKVA